MFSVLPSGIVNVSVRLVPGSALCSTAIAISFFSLIVLLFSCCCGVCFDYDMADQERRRRARYVVVIPEAQAPSPRPTGKHPPSLENGGDETKYGDGHEEPMAVAHAVPLAQVDSSPIA